MGRQSVPLRFHACPLVVVVWQPGTQIPSSRPVPSLTGRSCTVTTKLGSVLARIASRTLIASTEVGAPLIAELRPTALSSTQTTIHPRRPWAMQTETTQTTYIAYEGLEAFPRFTHG